MYLLKIISKLAVLAAVAIPFADISSAHAAVVVVPPPAPPAAAAWR